MASRYYLHMAMALMALAISTETSEASKRIAPPPRFTFKIDPETPLKDLLPPLPDTASKLPSVLNEDLALVPELTFARSLAKDLEFFKSQEETAHVMAKINHLNQKREDGFMKAYLAKRDDLRGLPFLLGKDCRTENKRAALLSATVQFIQLQLAMAQRRHTGDKGPPDESKVADAFWESLNFKKDNFEADDPSAKFLKSATPEDLDQAKVAALMQMITPLSEPFRDGLIKELSATKHADAARALAKLALYTPEEKLRAKAIAGLKDRDLKDYRDTLLAGFRYPLPAVSKRAAEALAKTGAKDAIDALIHVLDQPDPRAPAKKTVDGAEVSLVRELVRVNHHHNCLLCHAPANTPDMPKDVASAAVPQPSQPLPSPFQGYGSRMSPDIFVRIDMTYLRQDFSMLMKVEDAKPWPELQRYDFFVRERVITPAEAAERVKVLATQAAPNRAAAESALRELTGQSANNASAEEWRRLLKQP